MITNDTLRVSGKTRYRGVFSTFLKTEFNIGGEILPLSLEGRIEK